MTQTDDTTGAKVLATACRHAQAYLAGANDRPVPAQVSQAEIRARLVTDLPETGTPAEQVIEEFAKAAEGGIATTVGGRFHGFVIGGAHPVGVAADWLAAAWDDPPGTPLISPFGCAVDGIAGDWVRQLLLLPTGASVGLVTGATMGNFTGAIAARHALLQRLDWDVEARGLFGAPEIRVIVGADVHPTMLLALRFAGFGAERIIRIRTTGDGAMDAEALASALEQPAAATLVCAQAGQVNTGACDPFAQLAPLCREHGAWLHVDGAFGLWGQVSPATRPLLEGVEQADSWSVDSHKWLNTPYDCGFAIVRDPAAHAAAMSVSASYLPQQDGARDPSHFVPELSRRARGNAVYTTIRCLGREGVRKVVENCCARTRQMRDLLTAQAGITCLNDVVLNQAIFRFAPPGDSDPATADRITAQTVHGAVASGECFVQTAQWRGETVMRFSVCSHATTAADIDRTGNAILRAYAAAVAAV